MAGADAGDVWREGEGVIHFTLTGPLHGYTIQSRGSFWNKRSRAYHAWKDLVRLTARAAGVPDEIPEDERWGIRTVIYWKGKARVDPENIQKGILDSMWKQDRRVSHGEFMSYEKNGPERCEVAVWRVGK